MLSPAALRVEPPTCSVAVDEGQCVGQGGSIARSPPPPRARSAAIALTQCAPQGCADEAWKATYPVDRRPAFAATLSPGLEPGKVTSCLARESQVDGRAHPCRVVDGHEAVDDFPNWFVDGQPWESDPIPDSVIIGHSGEASSSWGISIVTRISGEQFEGCDSSARPATTSATTRSAGRRS